MRVIQSTSLKALPFIIFIAILGWYLPSAHIAGNSVMAQTSTDSIIAPNVFTPNGDGKNDAFEVTSKENNVVSLKIFTRAGVLVFSIEARKCTWDGCSLSGQPMVNGVYYYTAEVRGSSSKVSKSGFMHLYR